MNGWSTIPRARSAACSTIAVWSSSLPALNSITPNEQSALRARSRCGGRSPAPATNATDVTSPPPKVQQAQAARGVPDQSEIIITATKREENLQNVPISVQVLGTRRLDQLNISNFEQYTKQLPSVSFKTAQ